VEFKIFSSGGGWKFLFGKPLLHLFKALHNFDTDTVTIQSAHKSITSYNSIEKNALKAPAGVSLTFSVEQKENSTGGPLGVNPPLRQVLHSDIPNSLVQNDKSKFIAGYKDDVTKKTEEHITETDKEHMQIKETLMKKEDKVVKGNTLGEDHMKGQAMASGQE